MHRWSMWPKQFDQHPPHLTCKYSADLVEKPGPSTSANQIVYANCRVELLVGIDPIRGNLILAVVQNPDSAVPKADGPSSKNLKKRRIEQ